MYTTVTVTATASITSTSAAITSSTGTQTTAPGPAGSHMITPAACRTFITVDQEFRNLLYLTRDEVIELVNFVLARHEHDMIPTSVAEENSYAIYRSGLAAMQYRLANQDRYWMALQLTDLVGGGWDDVAITQLKRDLSASWLRDLDEYFNASI